MATARRSTRFEALIGFDRLKVFHLNDSKKPCMSRVDRHEHIGKGCIGLEPFRRLLNDPRFDHLPMILETEKSEWREKGKVVIDPLDEMNLNTLRSLRNTKRRSAKRSDGNRKSQEARGVLGSGDEESQHGHHEGGIGLHARRYRYSQLPLGRARHFGRAQL